jgi:hypothetical protein
MIGSLIDYSLSIGPLPNIIFSISATILCWTRENINSIINKKRFTNLRFGRLHRGFACLSEFFIERCTGATKKMGCKVIDIANYINIHALYFPKTNVVQLPPKAKELESTTSTSISRDFPGT